MNVIKTQMVSRGIAPRLPNLDVIWGEWPASNLVPFIPWTHGVGVWVCPIFVLNLLEERKISFPCREQNPGPFSTYPSYYMAYAIRVISFPYCTHITTNSVGKKFVSSLPTVWVVGHIRLWFFEHIQRKYLKYPHSWKIARRMEKHCNEYEVCILTFRHRASCI